MAGEQIEKKVDNVISKLEKMFTKWLVDFEARPVNMGLKLIFILYIVKKAGAWLKKQ